MKNASFPCASLKHLLLALAGCSACALGADDLTELSLDQLIDVPVVSASRFEQKASETTAAVSVVTRDDIRQYGWRTVAEVLRSLHGFYTHSDRGYDYVGARSFARPQDYNTRVLLLVDGQRVNDAIYDQAYIGTDGIIDLDIVDRIEVIRGPGSSIYGGNAVFGVINLITRSGAQLDGGELGARISSHNTIDGRASVGKRLDNGADFLASVSGMNATGPALYFPEFDTPANNGGHTAHTDYTRQGSVFARVGIDGLRLTTAASRRTKGVPTGAFGAEFNDRGHAFIDTQSYLAVDYTRALDAATEIVKDELQRGVIRPIRPIAFNPADYDVVVIDLPDERSDAAQHNRLYGADFMKLCGDIGVIVAGQAGCPTLWRNETLIRSWERFGETFGTVVYFGSDEHEWAFLSGAT